MVHVMDNYYFDADSNCYTALEDTLKKDKDDKPVYRTIGYYPSAKDAVKGIAKYIHKKLAGNEESSSIELSEYIKNCEDVSIKLQTTLDDMFQAVDF